VKHDEQEAYFLVRSNAFPIVKLSLISVDGCEKLGEVLQKGHRVLLTKNSNPGPFCWNHWLKQL
jgi:hypothetical protein